MKIGLIVGNFRAQSKTLLAATLVVEKLAGRAPDHVLDLITLGPALLQHGDPGIARAIEALQKLDVLVVASPTYKAAYSGVLKLFLDQIGPGGLSGLIALPVMLGGSLAHALATDVFLRPVLTQLGAACPMPGLFLLEQSYMEDPQLDDWVTRAKTLVLHS